MSSIAIVGDPHIATTVSNRIDDYFETCLEKLTQLAEENDHVIFLGDVFSYCALPFLYFNRLYTHLTYISTKYNCKFYAIIGNHDIANDNEITLDSTALGAMFKTKAIIPITVDNPVIIDNYRFNTTYVRYTKAKKHLNSMKGKYNNDQYEDVLLVHHYFEEHGECFTYEDYKDLGVRHIFMGHEHCPLPQGKLVFNEFTIYRSGSMTRNIAAPYNFERTLYYIVIDTKSSNIYCKPINCKPASEVFTQEAFTRENYQRTKFVESINDIIHKYTSNTNTQAKFSIYVIMKEIQTPQAHLDYIESKYIKIGERFK